MQDKLIEILLLVLLVVVGLFILVAVVAWVLPNTAPLGTLADIILALVTIFAILFGGIFAATKLELFRDFEPHLNVTHVIHHRGVGDSYVHLDVTVALQNSSRVKVVLQKGFLVLQRISPTTDEAIERVYEEAFAGEYIQDFSWAVLEEEFREWREDELTIEPGEIHREVLEFIISREVHTIQVYTFYYNSKSSDETTGWSMATVYDIMN